MKIEINAYYDSAGYPDGYFAQVWDGPDGIDCEDFQCGSLGECFEKILSWRTINALHYR